MILEAFPNIDNSMKQLKAGCHGWCPERQKAPAHQSTAHACKATTPQPCTALPPLQAPPQEPPHGMGTGASRKCAACPATGATSLSHDSSLPFPLSKVGTWSSAVFVNEQSWFSHKTVNGAMSSLDIDNTLKFKHVICTRILQGVLIIWEKRVVGSWEGSNVVCGRGGVGGRVTGDDQSQKGNNCKLKIWKHISSHKWLRLKPKHSYSQEDTVSQGAIKAWCYYFQGMPLKLCLQT